MVTRKVRHYDQYERQSDASMHWDIRLVLLKAFAKNGALVFSEKYWLRLIHEGSSKQWMVSCEDSKNSLVYFRAIQGHSGGIFVEPELTGYIRILHKWKRFNFHRGCSFSIQSIFENGLIPGGHESDKGRQIVFFTPLNFLVEILKKKNFMTITQFLKKRIVTVIGKAIKMQCIGQEKSRAQDRRLQFWQTKSHAIIVHSLVPADSIFQAISQKGDRVLFERLSTPQPAPKVTFKKAIGNRSSSSSSWFVMVLLAPRRWWRGRASLGQETSMAMHWWSNEF